MHVKLSVTCSMLWSSLDFLIVQQAARGDVWRLTKPYCFHFPHQCPQMCSAGRSMKLLPGNKLCFRPESLCMHAHCAAFSSFLSIFFIIP